MNIRLDRIEHRKPTGVISLFFQKLFGWPAPLEEKTIIVSDAGLGIDLDVTALIPSGYFVMMCITDNLEEAEQQLQSDGIPYEGPLLLYPGLTTIRYTVAGRNMMEISMPR